MMPAIIATLSVACAAFAVWLTVRVINRRERWAKRTAAAMVAAPALYFLSWGPAIWLYHKLGRPRWFENVVGPVYLPLDWIAAHGPVWLTDALASYWQWWLPM
jgi:hypothetical protein